MICIKPFKLETEPETERYLKIEIRQLKWEIHALLIS